MVRKRKGATKNSVNDTNGDLAAAELYIEQVLAGEIVVGSWIRLACERHLRDLDRVGDPKFPYHFDREEALYGIAFFKYLHHSKGEWAGQVFELEPWQQFLVWSLFGWRRDSDGTRRFRTSYLEVARKNGKTTLAAAIGLFCLDSDGEAGAEVYAAATKYDQAKLVHTEAKRMVRSSAQLKQHIQVWKQAITVESTNSTFVPLGRDHDSLDGLNVHCAIVDEVHAHKHRDLWDVLETGTASRRQPLIFAITTAGFDKQSLCYELRDYSTKILDNIIEDETFFCLIYTIDDDDDWEDPRIWQKANPNLYVSTKFDDLERKARKAKELPSAQNAFKRLHLNIWTEAETRWLTAKQWAACSFGITEDQLAGRTCYAGLDLSSNRDVTAFVLVFPPWPEHPYYCILPRFFIPKDNMKERVRRDRVPYDIWSEQKGEGSEYSLMIATPGNVIDYRWILDQVDKDAQAFDLKEIAFDRWGATKIVQDLQEMGFEKPTLDPDAAKKLIDFGQGYASMAKPTKELERMVLAKEIDHGSNPVLAWMASNVVVLQDPAGNIKCDKSKSTEKIDGVVASIMGLDRAVIHDDGSSVYDTKGVVTL